MYTQSFVTCIPLEDEGEDSEDMDKVDMDVGTSENLVLLRDTPNAAVFELVENNIANGRR